MKPIHLNLSSKPFRNDVPVNTAIAALVLATALLAYFNVDAYLRYLSETKSTRTRIAKIQSQTRDEQRRREAAQQWMRGLNLAALNNQTRFINTELAQRAFSWSELLDRLESVLPDDVRIHAVAPAFDKSGLVRLTLQCDSKGPNGMIETINRMNADSHFANAYPRVMMTDNTGQHFDIEVSYRPTLARGGAE